MAASLAALAGASFRQVSGGTTLGLHRAFAIHGVSPTIGRAIPKMQVQQEARKTPATDKGRRQGANDQPGLPGDKLDPSPMSKKCRKIDWREMRVASHGQERLPVQARIPRQFKQMAKPPTGLCPRVCKIREIRRWTAHGARRINCCNGYSASPPLNS